VSNVRVVLTQGRWPRGSEWYSVLHDNESVGSYRTEEIANGIAAFIRNPPDDPGLTKCPGCGSDLLVHYKATADLKLNFSKGVYQEWEDTNVEMRDVTFGCVGDCELDFLDGFPATLDPVGS
jgi:hypothetical protein